MWASLQSIPSLCSLGPCHHSLPGAKAYLRSSSIVTSQKKKTGWSSLVTRRKEHLHSAMFRVTLNDTGCTPGAGRMSLVLLGLILFSLPKEAGALLLEGFAARGMISRLVTDSV
jgi:hypothetical protein